VGILLSFGGMSSPKSGPVCEVIPQKKSWKDWAEIGALFVIVWGLYHLLSTLHLIPKLTIQDEMSLGFVFLIGLVAASSSCIAVAGGLLLAVTARYSELHPELKGWARFRPHLGFNLGRILSYTIFGGLVGLLGSAFVFSSFVTGAFTILAGVAMLLAGFRLLNLFPRLTRWQPILPKYVSERLFGRERSTKHAAPFLVGAGTFFVPCGFTQALQLYVLSRGHVAEGALIMLFFSLGTLPALLSVAAISSFSQGTFRRFFIRASGVVVILLGVFSLSNGLDLAGVSSLWKSMWGPSSTMTSLDANVEIVDGVQIAKMKISGLNYFPHQFRVRVGVPVEWRIDGTLAEGCAQSVQVPKLGITRFLSPTGETVIRFTPTEPGPIAFSCTMGMTTKGSAFIVEGGATSMPGDPRKAGCDETITDCKI
jgi:uncharacterized protein